MDQNSPNQSAETNTTDEAAIQALRPELQPIARRHGLAMLEFAVRVSACNVALDGLIELAKRANLHGNQLQPLVAMLVNAQADMLNSCMEARAWEWDKLVEVIQDVGRAGKLAAASQPGQGPGTPTVQ